MLGFVYQRNFLLFLFERRCPGIYPTGWRPRSGGVRTRIPGHTPALTSCKIPSGAVALHRFRAMGRPTTLLEGLCGHAVSLGAQSIDVGNGDRMARPAVEAASHRSLTGFFLASTLDGSISIF